MKKHRRPEAKANSAAFHEGLASGDGPQEANPYEQGEVREAWDLGWQVARQGITEQVTEYHEARKFLASMGDEEMDAVAYAWLQERHDATTDPDEANILAFVLQFFDAVAIVALYELATE